MRAMVMDAAQRPLRLVEMPRPQPRPGELLIEVHACGVCRTDLHVIDGELTNPKLPLILGHEIVGTVVEGPRKGERVGVPWLGATCGHCGFCTSGRENLCAEARFTGYQLDGGYAELTVAREEYCFQLPKAFNDLEAAPLLCAGLIGYRSLRMAGDAKRLGLYGFGAAAHILAQVAAQEGRRVFAFTRTGDTAAQALARSLGAVWAGGSEELPPEPLDAAILFAPVGALVPAALRVVERGGTVVCGGIHMSDLPSFRYSLLWGERMVRSVANLTRHDGEEYFRVIAPMRLRLDVHPYPLERANEALSDLRAGRFTGAAVLSLANKVSP